MECIAVTIAEAARISGLSRTAIYNCINDGRLQARKIGKRRLVMVASIRDLLDNSALR